MDKFKTLLKTSYGKIGLGLIAFGILAIIATQAASNGTSFGQSLLVGCVFFVIGAFVITKGNKKASMLNCTDAETAKEPPGAVYVYSGSKVYHTYRFCSESYENTPLILSENEAEDKGYRKCKKCEKYDQTPY